MLIGWQVFEILLDPILHMSHGSGEVSKQSDLKLTQVLQIDNGDFLHLNYRHLSGDGGPILPAPFIPGVLSKPSTGQLLSLVYGGYEADLNLLFLFIHHGLIQNHA